MQVTGTIGKFITKSLLETGKHKITALTRGGSSSKAPEGVDTKIINYDDSATLVDALKGQDALIVTLSAMAPPEQQTKLIDAAAAANVPWVIPNEYGYGWENSGAGKDTFLGTRTEPYRKQIEQLGKSSWIAVSCGFWYQFSLASPNAFGFDFENRSVTFVDDGTTKINTSTWQQSGLGVAKLLSLKVLPDDESDTAPTLSQFKNKPFFYTSFKVSQGDIFESVLRVTGTKPEDWKITHQEHEERYTTALKRLQTGDHSAFQQVLYTRAFYPDGSGDLEAKGLANEILDLPKEDLDQWTKVGIELSPIKYG